MRVGKSFLKNVKLLLLIFGMVIVIMTVLSVRQHYEIKKGEHLTADQVYLIPSKLENKFGFTCTGLFYDKERDVFYIGNAGKIKPDEEKFEATIEIVDSYFDSILKSIDCYKVFDNMRDIQGVCIDENNTIWFCSYGENLVRHVDADGNSLGKIPVNAPSGIAYDKRDNTIWVLTDSCLLNYTFEGKLVKKIKIREKGQDQLFLDSDNDKMYVSVGADYHGESYIYVVDLNNKKAELAYVLNDSYAIEGITIKGNDLYVLNDGYYHNADVPYNQVNIYNLKD